MIQATTISALQQVGLTKGWIADSELWRVRLVGEFRKKTLRISSWGIISLAFVRIDETREKTKKVNIATVKQIIQVFFRTSAFNQLTCNWGVFKPSSTFFEYKNWWSLFTLMITIRSHHMTPPNKNGGWVEVGFSQDVLGSWDQRLGSVGYIPNIPHL